jgi:N-acetylmuramoyl-L-alanine amidase
MKAAPPKTRLVCLILAGHSGIDPGTSAAEYTEAEFTYALAQDLMHALERHRPHIEPVLLSTAGHTGPTKRVGIQKVHCKNHRFLEMPASTDNIERIDQKLSGLRVIKALYRQTHKADCVLIELHADARKGPDGLHVLYGAAGSESLAQAIAGPKSKVILRDDLRLLRLAPMPSVIVEAFNMSSPKSLKLFLRKSHRAAFAKQVAQRLAAHVL